MPSYAESPFERIVNVHWKKKPGHGGPPWPGIDNDYSCYWPAGTSAQPNYGGLDLSSGIFSYWYRYPFGGIAPPPEEVNDYFLFMLVGGQYVEGTDNKVFVAGFTLGGHYPGGPYNISNGYGLEVVNVVDGPWSVYQTDCVFSALPTENWHHIISAWNGAEFQCYVDGVDRRTDDINVGGGAVPGVYDVVSIFGYPILLNSFFTGLLSNVYVAAGQFLDLGTNIQKFRDPHTGNPADLGPHGERPTGKRPTLWSPTPISNYRGDPSGHPDSRLPNLALDDPDPKLSDWTVHSQVNGSVPVSNLSFSGVPISKPWWPGQPV